MALSRKINFLVTNFKINIDKCGLYLLALFLAVRDLRVTPYDDAAITYRYAWNISHWHGWVYNVGDRTNGASSPFYTLLLAIGSRLGFPLPGLSEALDALSYGAIALLIYLIVKRCLAITYKNDISSSLIAAFGVTLFLLSEGARSILLSGMETAVCSALGLSAIWLIVSRRFSLAWLVMGLALFSKLDAFALLPTMIMLQLYLRKPSGAEFLLYLRNLVVIFGPWLLFSQFYFGSMLPHSASEKLSGSLTHVFKLNHMWVVNHIASEGYLLLLAAVTLITCLIFYWSKEKGAVTLAFLILMWPILHGGFFSIVNLGDQYDWYLGVLYAPIIISITFLLKFIYERGSVKFNGIFRFAVIAVVVPSIIMGHNFKATFEVIKHGHQISSYEGFEKTRAEAGIWLGTHVPKSDVIMTCFGWVAWGVKENPFFETCPLSTRKSVGSPNWFVDCSFPGIHVPKASPIGKIEKVFTSSIGTGGASWIVKIGPVS